MYFLELDRSLTPLPNGALSAAATRIGSWPVQRFFEFQPLPQFGEALVGEAGTGAWALITPEGDYRPMPALRGEQGLDPTDENPAQNWAIQNGSVKQVLLSFFHSQWLLSADGKTQRLPDQIGRARATADLPGSKDTIIGTDKGLFRLNPNGNPQAVPDADADQVEAVRKMTPIPWRNELLIEAGHGVFSYSADKGLRALPAFHWRGRLPKIFVLPNLKQIWALDPGVQYGDGSVYRGQLRRIELGSECQSSN